MLLNKSILFALFVLYSVISVNGGACQCDCCIGNFCTSQDIGSYEVYDCSDCSSSGCADQFPSECPSGTQSGVASGTCFTVNSGAITCQYFQDSFCTNPMPGFTAAYYDVGLCNPSTAPPSEITSIVGNQAEICFYLDTSCSIELGCSQGSNNECVLLTTSPNVYGKCSWNESAFRWYYVVAPVIVLAFCGCGFCGFCFWRRRFYHHHHHHHEHSPLVHH